MNYYNVLLWLGLGQIVSIEVEQKRVLKDKFTLLYIHTWHVVRGQVMTSCRQIAVLNK